MDLTILSGSSHPELCAAICTTLGVKPASATITTFSNENIKVRIDESVRGRDVFVVQTSCPPVHNHLVELLMLIDALRGASAGRITAVIPYYFYARSDKKDEPRISITARLVADLLQTAGADRVLTLDLHSPQAHGFFKIPVDHITAVPLLVQSLLADRELMSAPVVVAPDVGESKDAGRMARSLHAPLAIVDKRRTGDDEKARPVHMVGDVAGHHAVMVDDEMATGGTIFEAARFVTERGALSVRAAVVHGVLSGGCLDRLRASDLTRLIITDTIPLPESKRDPRIEVVSVAPLLAEAISRIHNGQSVSAMMSTR
ncbi:MAG: ribose-phosphate pyrophosphokinase [Deltaproteobacteria bacterium]|nr:ribose-phosphate pyrophosphokinase [Deltaproteobacteria bacterium]